MSKVKHSKRAVWHISTDGSEDIEGVNGLTIEEVLGKGQYGIVYKVKGKTHIGKGLSKPLALKVLNRNKMRKSRDPVGQSSDGAVVYMNGQDKVTREIRIMSYLQKLPSLSDFSDSDGEGDQHMKASDFPDVQSAIAAGCIPSSPSDRLSPVSSNLLRKTIKGSKPLPKPGVSGLAKSSLGSASKTPVKDEKEAKDGTDGTDGGSESKNPYRKYIVALKEIIDDANDESYSMLFTYMPGGSLMKMNSFALSDGAQVQRFFAPADLMKNRGSFLLIFAGEQEAVASLEGDNFNFSDAAIGHSSNAPKARFQRCDGYDASSIYALTQQLLLAVKFIHERHVAHRDIKPENLLLDDQSVLHLADFGCAEYHSESASAGSAGDSVFQFDRSNGFVRHTSGTPAYWAPECVKGALSDTNTSTAEEEEMIEALTQTADFISLDANDGRKRAHEFDVFAVDMWAVGLCLHAMLFNRLPFRVGGDPLQMFDDIVSAEPVPTPLLSAQQMAISTQDGGPSSSPLAAAPMHPSARAASSPTSRRLAGHTESVAQVEHAAWAEALLTGLLERDPRRRLTVDEALRVMYSSVPRKGM